MRTRLEFASVCGRPGDADAGQYDFASAAHPNASDHGCVPNTTAASNAATRKYTGSRDPS